LPFVCYVLGFILSPELRKRTKERKRIRAGTVAQVVEFLFCEHEITASQVWGPELKPQYHHKRKKEKKRSYICFMNYSIIYNTSGIVKLMKIESNLMLSGLGQGKWLLTV
jgi:hypothetical protein